MLPNRTLITVRSKLPHTRSISPRSPKFEYVSLREHVLSNDGIARQLHQITPNDIDHEVKGNRVYSTLDSPNSSMLTLLKDICHFFTLTIATIFVQQFEQN